jgi:hypothetical protein
MARYNIDNFLLNIHSYKGTFMKTKNIAFIIILSSLMVSETCSGMSYIRNWYNSLTTTKSDQSSPSWMQRFITKCRKVGIFPTISSAFGIYNFNTITGLDENRLSTYNSITIKNAMKRIDTLAKYGTTSQTLENFYNALQIEFLKAQNKEKYPMEELAKD